MRIMLAPDSFKESLSAEAAAEAMAAGIAQVDPMIEIDRCPISDGGEGFVAALSTAANGTAQQTVAAGPLADPVEAAWATLPDQTAVIEMAAASGLERLTADQRNPLRTTTLGTGQLIAAALEHGCGKILVGLGGSATTDGGTGMAQALGVRFFDREGQLITRPMCGGVLHEIARIDMDAVWPALRNTKTQVACDVTNPLTGPTGAAAIYGPQKGATPDQVAQLDDGLRHLARLIREQLNLDVEHVPGAGAAGGLGGGLIAFAGATLTSGIELVLDATRFAERVAACDLCLTGEGRLDSQSLSGKAILGIARPAQQHNVPTIALVGSADHDAAATLHFGLHAYHEISTGHPLEYALEHADELLAVKVESVVRAWINQRGA